MQKESNLAKCGAYLQNKKKTKKTAQAGQFCQTGGRFLLCSGTARRK